MVQQDIKRFSFRWCYLQARGPAPPAAPVRMSGRAAAGPALSVRRPWRRS